MVHETVLHQCCNRFIKKSQNQKPFVKSIISDLSKNKQKE